MVYLLAIWDRPAGLPVDGSVYLFYPAVNCLSAISVRIQCVTPGYAVPEKSKRMVYWILYPESIFRAYRII